MPLPEDLVTLITDRTYEIDHAQRMADVLAELGDFLRLKYKSTTAVIVPFRSLGSTSFFSYVVVLFHGAQALITITSSYPTLQRGIDDPYPSEYWNYLSIGRGVHWAM